MMYYENHVSETLGNGNVFDYKVANGVFYHEKTNDAIVTVLERVRKNDERIRIYLGDTETGQCWFEEYDIMGYVGRTTGRISRPLLLNNARSISGGIISDNCIVKIVRTSDNQVLYKHPTFRIGEFTMKEEPENEYKFIVFIDGVNHANFKDRNRAERWMKFMKGESNKK